ncbi:MAG: glycosyltransferase family A protein [Candidatus Moranbacteria bacterium]|nr:glycosyltransferase family A protein [Candidatus Moranbacteria bacterium]
MFTIFTIPKPFKDPHINIIQRNAIQSWKELANCEIFLMGDDEGVREVAEELEVGHIPKIKKNEYGTPLLDSAFKIAREKSSKDYLVYINADILLTPDFININNHLPQKDFLIVGQRWDADIDYSIDFADKNWPEKVWDKVKKEGKIHTPTGSDYFIFKKDSFSDIPSFAVGRVGWDNWMIYKAVNSDMLSIDASKFYKVIHQNHDYRHLTIKKQGVYSNPEAQKNKKLAGGGYHLECTEYNLTKRGLKKKIIDFRRIKKGVIKILLKFLRKNKK